MRRITLALLLAIAAGAHAADKWFDHYKRGVAAVNGRSYKLALDLLQKSIAEMPNEATGVRAGKEIIVYVPHFWLGIAKFNYGDVDGALREWRTSEEQGAIARTEYYAKLKDWVARAQTEKHRLAQSEASGAKKAADAAISRALALQVDALSAGGDRSESYRAAQRKLQEALARFHRAGTDVGDYKAAERMAQEASATFATAAEEGRKLKASRPAASVAKPKAQAPTPVREQPKPQPVQQQLVPPAVKMETAPPPTAVESAAKVDAEIAVQQYRRRAGEAPPSIARAESREVEKLRRALESATSDIELEQIARRAKDLDSALSARIVDAKAPPAESLPRAGEVSVTAPASLPDLRDAYRAYAEGDLGRSEALLTRIVDLRPSAEAYLLRGCARYTRAILSGAPESELDAAAADFRIALQRNRALRLDRNIFSPKLVAFFEKIRERI